MLGIYLEEASWSEYIKNSRNRHKKANDPIKEWTEFSKEIKMALKHKNVHLTIMGMQIKTAFGFPHTLVRTAKIKETNESVADGAGKAQPSFTAGAATGTAFMESVWRSQKR